MRQLVVALSVLTCAVLLAPAGHADVYKWVDEEGVIHLADRPLGPGYTLYMRGGTSPLKSSVKARKPSSKAYAENRRRFSPVIDLVARQQGLDRALLHAVVTAESAYDPAAISRAGARGLMQLMPATAQRYGVRDIHDPLQNVQGGTRYLRDLIVQFQNVRLALAAYNAGENAVMRYGNDVPPFPETQHYVRKVIELYHSYRASL